MGKINAACLIYMSEQLDDFSLAFYHFYALEDRNNRSLASAKANLFALMTRAYAIYFSSEQLNIVK